MRETKPKHDMNFAFFQKITREMKEAGVEEIGLFFLGESFSNVDLLVNCVYHCKDIGIPYVFLTTNGSLADKDAVKRVMDAGLDSLKFSVNAADPEQFEQVMGVAAKNWYRSLDNIRAARKVRDEGRYSTRLYASSIRFDGEQQTRMEKLLGRCVLPFVDEHYWLPLYSMGSFATQREEELGYRPTAGNQGRLGALREPLPCWSAFTEGHVTAEGYLSACCFDATSAWRMGDLKQQTFMEAWNSPEFMNLREAHLKKDVTGTVCQDCIAYA